MAGKLSLFISAVFVTAPAMVSNVSYLISKNPELRPLGVTQESLARHGGSPESSSIGVYVDVGTDRTSQVDEAELRAFIARAMDVRTDNYYIRFKDVPGSQIRFTLVVGPNSYGPYPPGNLQNGVVHAAAALQMTRDANG